MDLHQYANQIRGRKMGEVFEATRASNERAKALGEAVIARLGNIYPMIQAAGITMAVGCRPTGNAFIHFSGHDMVGGKQGLTLPVDEEKVKTFDPEILVLILDKYIILGYPPPDPRVSQTISLDLDEEKEPTLKTSFGDFSAN